MRSSRMRGYGSWTIGWREGERNRNPSPGNNGGCGVVAFFIIIMVLVSSVNVAMETGSVFALILGLAIVMGVLNGLNKE